MIVTPQPLKGHKLYARVLLAVVPQCFSLHSQFSENAVLLSKGRADTAHINSKLLPAGSVFELDTEMRFLLHGHKGTDLQIIPLGLNVHAPSREHSECGVYFSSVGGRDQYLPVQGHNPADDMCDGIKAVGLVRDPGPRPRMIVIANAYNVHGTYRGQPFILHWNPAASSYEIDAGLSDLIARQKGSSTIAGVRALLNARH